MNGLTARAAHGIGSLAVVALLACGGGGSATGGGGTGTSHSSTGGTSTGGMGTGGTGAAAPEPDVPLGVGLEGVTDWSRARMFADLVKSSRRFGSASQPWDGAAPVDANGWPTSDFGVVLWTGMASQHGYGGTYRIQYTGPAGVVIAAAASSADFGPVTRDAATGVCTLDMTVAEGADQLMLTFTGTGGGLKDVSILRPGAAAGQTFSASFLGLLAPFQVLRCMDVLNTNGSPVATWADRAKPTDAQWASEKGVPWEVLLQLSAESGKDLWINVPHQADDDYLKQLAALVKQKLPAGRRLYVEYSNEVWNWGFDQSHWAYDRAGVLAAEAGSPLTWNGETNPGYWHWRFVALRLKQISDAFRAEMGDAAIGATIRPVLAGQVVQPVTVRTGLEMIEGVFGAPSKFFHGVAGAPYFNLGDADQATNLSTDDVISALQASVAKVPTDDAFDENLAVALTYRLPFLAYEGGPDTFGPNNQDAKLASASDPRMKGMCRSYLDRWYAQGFGLFNWFTLTSAWDGPYGTWGLTDDPTVTSTPKLDALREALAAPRPALVAGTLLPADLDARAWVGNGDLAADPYLRWMHVGDHRDYLVRVEQTPVTALVLETAASAGTSEVAVDVDGTAAGKVTLASTGGDETWKDQAPLAVSLPAGVHVVRLTTTVDGGFAVKTLRLH